MTVESFEFRSEGYEKAYLKYLEKENKYLNKMMWIAWFGWAISAIMLWTLI